MLKSLVKDGLRAAGVSVKPLGTGLSGVDIEHDVRVTLGRTERPILFDVGANVGDKTVEMRRAYPQATIYAFEPSPKTFESLRDRLKGDSAIHPVHTAVSHQEHDAAPFHITADHSVNDSLLAPVSHREQGVTMVPVTTLDAFCASRVIDQIDWLKIDTQGSDVDVLRGADQLLKDRRIRLVTAEAIVAPRYHGQHTVADLLVIMQSHGYRIVGFYDPLYLSDGLSSFDVLFGRPD